MGQLRVRAAVKRRLVELAEWAYRESKFTAQQTTYWGKDPDHVLYIGIDTTGETDPESVSGRLATERVTIGCRIESYGYRGKTDAADAEAAVEEAFNLFERTLIDSDDLILDAVPSEADENGRPVYIGASRVRIDNVTGPNHWRPPDGKPVFGVIEFDVTYVSHLS